MKLRISLFITIAVLLLLAALSIPGSFVEARLLPPTAHAGLRGLCPPVQNTPYFTIAYGAVTLDGASAPVGTVVEAHSPRGDVVGCFEVTTAGNYGMMYIYGEDTTVTPPIPGMRAGETVTFYVDGSPATATPSLTWTNDKTWHQVDLVAVGTPHAEFSATPLQGPASLAVNFTNLSTGNYTTCAWTFGDGSTSNVCSSPVHTYNARGVYTVTLAVSGPGGSDTETKTGYISIFAPVDARFTVTPTTGIAPLAVTFDNLSTGDYETCSWAFGDDTSSNVCTPPAHTYDTPGVYTVTLTVSGPGGVDTESQTVTAFERVDAQFSGTPEAGVAPLAVMFSNLSIGDYTTCVWDFGDSSTSTDCSPPSHTYSAPGVYTVTLSVSGLGGADTEAKTNYITVYARLHADFSATPTQGVAPLEVTFNNLSVGDYTSCYWVFGDGITSTLQHPVHTYNLSGVYTVSLTIRGVAGEDTKTSTDFISVKRDYMIFLPVVIRGN